MRTSIQDDSIRILADTGEEIMGWHIDEWVEDPETVVHAIANAIRLCYEDPALLLHIIHQRL